MTSAHWPNVGVEQGEHALVAREQAGYVPGP